MAGSIGKIAIYSIAFQRFKGTCFALSKAMWGDAEAGGGYGLPQYDSWINGFVNYNAGIGCTYGFIIPASTNFYYNAGNFDIGVYNGNQLCRVAGGPTGIFSYNNTWNQAVLSSRKKALLKEKYYLDIYNTMQKEYPNFKFLIHDDDIAQKYYVVVDDGNGKLLVRKLNLVNKTDEPYLTYANFNLIALINYAKANYPLLDKQVSQLEEIVMNNQSISVIDANKIVYDNDIFTKNYLNSNFVHIV